MLASTDNANTTGSTGSQNANAAPKYLREAQDEWLSIAEKQLSA